MELESKPKALKKYGVEVVPQALTNDNAQYN